MSENEESVSLKPWTPGLAERSFAKPSAHFDPSQHLVVVVDDDPDHLAMLACIVKAGAFQVYTTANSAECFEIIRSRSVSAVVSDMHMPGTNGLEFVKQIRANREHLHDLSIPVILVTAGQTDLQYEVVFQGASLFCAKKDAAELLVRQLRFVIQRNLQKAQQVPVFKRS